MQMTVEVLHTDGSEDRYDVKSDAEAWRKTKEAFSHQPSARILVKTSEGIVRDLRLVETKRGMVMSNSLKRDAPDPVTQMKTIEAKASKEEKHGGCIFITA